jgi:hypothetical protein
MPAAAPPFVVMLERLAYRVPVDNLTTLASAAIFDVDPETNPLAKPTMLAALTPEHHASVAQAEAPPLLGRPTCFVRRVGGLELWPRCDRTYWFRATYRASIKLGTGGQA